MHVIAGPSIQVLGSASPASEEVGDYRNNRQNRKEMNQAR